MPIISFRYNGNNRWKGKATKNKDRKEQRGDVSYSESVRAKWFCCAFNLGFLKLISKASLMFKSNLEFCFINYFKRKNHTSQSMLRWSV